jgi:hypothetical protein
MKKIAPFIILFIIGTIIGTCILKNAFDYINAKNKAIAKTQEKQ